MGKIVVGVEVTRGTELVSKFNELARRASVRDTLKEGIMKQTDHEVTFGTTLTVPAYVAKFKTDFWTGKKLSDALVKFALDNFGSEETVVNHNYDLPPWILPRLNTWWFSSQTEFVIRIRLTAEEYTLFLMMPHLPRVQEKFFGKLNPSLVF